ncbi:MAG: hypothetical protein AB1757_28990 [Acidobacteriota bacterium]
MAQNNWRQASEKELKVVLPARAPVEKERIETEFRTAAGITDGRGKFIAGILMITAGYAAEGKYSHFLTVQTPIQVGDFTLPRGEYVFGSQRVDDETLEVKFYVAANGRLVGSAKAQRGNRRGAIRSFWINLPDKGAFTMLIGRFAIDCKFAS